MVDTPTSDRLFDCLRGSATRPRSKRATGSLDVEAVEWEQIVKHVPVDESYTDSVSRTARYLDRPVGVDVSPRG